MTNREFQKQLKQTLSSPSLGEPPMHKQKSDGCEQGPAHRELHASGLIAIILSEEFCRSIYALRQLHQELNTERLKAAKVSKSMVPIVRRYRNAERCLRRCAQHLALLDKKYRDLIDLTSMQSIYSTGNLLEGLANSIESRGKVSVSNIHPTKRKRHHAPSDWELVLRSHEYPLDRLVGKEPDQWFWVNVKIALQNFIQRKNVGPITNTTQLKLIAAISGAAIGVNVSHLAIKEFFIHLPAAKNRLLQEKSLVR